MVTLALATRDIVRSGYKYLITADHQQKVKEMETLVLGVAKVCAIFGTFSSLYAAYFLVERRDLQLILAGLTVCMHPVAALDIMGSAAGVYGGFQVNKGVLLHRENRTPLAQWSKLALEQLKREGYQFYSFGDVGPPETIERFKELLRELCNKHFESNSRDQWAASVNEAAGYLKSGLLHLGISVLSTIVCVSLPENPFWLDRKMVDLSKWLAPKIV